jgi:hypothetical protein
LSSKIFLAIILFEVYYPFQEKLAPETTNPQKFGHGTNPALDSDNATDLPVIRNRHPELVSAS